MNKFLIVFVLILASLQGKGQQHELKSTVQIYQDIQQLQRGLRVLYVAAHPDDENTRLISWLEKDQHIETAYLSLTRGQGGQNLIGDEKGDALGVIRTHELLEARKIDGAEQYFTRAIDFGYSKSAEESFEIWGKEAVLSDVVYVIRKFRPHVIITRFPPTAGAGHGHHEASAILAEEAFDLAGNADAFPEQLSRVQPWQAEVLYHNASSWWDKSLDEKSAEELLESRTHRVEAGKFIDVLGMATNELAALARSKHRCQAFGTPRSRGALPEYLRFVKGEWKEDLFESIRGTWSQSPEHADALALVLEHFDFTNRDANAALLQQHLFPLLAQRNMWADEQDMQDILMKVQRLRLDLTGLRVEVFAGVSPVVVGREYEVVVEVYNAGAEPREVSFKHPVIDSTLVIDANALISWKAKLTAPPEPTQPFWLKQPHDGKRYFVDPAIESCMPVSKPEAIAYLVKDKGQWLMGESALHRRWNDRSIGEISQPMLFVAPVAINPQVGKLVVRNGSMVELELELQAFEDVESLDIDIQLPEGLAMESDNLVTSMKAGQHRVAVLKLLPESLSTPVVLRFSAKVNGIDCSWSFDPVEYEHIPYTGMHTAANIELIPLAIDFEPSRRILYVDGSGDEVDDALLNLGYRVEHTSLNALSDEDLDGFDAIITGIRAFNRNEDLLANTARLNDYARRGGKVIVQYNTTFDLKLDQIGPYPFELSRIRVTDENAAVTLLEAKHPVLNQPNKIGDEDWQGWVQERGLYFAGTWDKAFVPVLAWNDHGEEPARGGLIIARHGKGYFVYTGISFFRQLPAGVPGAFRLMVNMIEFE